LGAYKVDSLKRLFCYMLHERIQNCILLLHMNTSTRLKILLSSGRTVFRSQDLRMLWKDTALTAKISAARMVEQKLILRLAKGYYAIDENYDTRTLANLVISPSYVSFNSALSGAGINFQQRNSVDSVALLSYRRKIQGITYAYYAMKEELFFWQEGISTKNSISIACPERAILDSLYFGFIPDIDTPDRLDRRYLKQLSEFFPLTVQKKVRKLYGTQI
jgi:predicted transcriptional regulator of viral defense system